MRIQSNRNLSSSMPRYCRGFGLLDVLLGIVIFVIGMLALASLQGNLTRSSADANARTIGANFAEEVIEDYRSFDSIWTDLDPDTTAFQDIVDETITETRSGVAYTVDVTVEDWFFKPDRVSVTDDTDDLPGRDTTIADFKYVEIAVAWAGTEFQINEASESTGRFGSGDFTVSSIIASSPPGAAAKIAAEDDGAPGSPPTDYDPGARPDIIAIEFDGTKYKESTTPEPIIRRADELIETWFDVITYQGTSDAIFVRREEFVSISCECKLYAASGSDKDGRGPTIWTGAEYYEPALQGKPYGVGSSPAQSQYCDVCCRDHHDSSSSVKFRPWMDSGDYVSGGSFDDDHPHYNRDKRGDWVEATKDGDTYLEACRLIRKDGFFRVAQDFDINQVNAFPEDYLVSDGDLSEYSDYVKDVADYNLGQIDVVVEPLSANVVLTFDGRNFDNPTDIPVVATLAETQQLRSRGIYVDAMNAMLQANIDNCFGLGDINDCEAPEADSVYEIYPFYEVQVTSLARWTEDKVNDPVHISNEELDKRGYSRGFAELAGTEIGRGKGLSTIETGNVGLISTLPVTLVPAAEYLTAEIFIRANEGDTEPPGSLPKVTGNLTNEGGTSDAAILILTGSTDVTCDKPTVETFSCTIGPGAGPLPTITVSNYYNTTKLLLICSDSIDVTEISHVNTSVIATENHTIFSIPVGGVSDITLSISKSGC